MKAVVFKEHGGPEVLTYSEVTDPAIQEDEVLVRVSACSINHLDIWLRQGIPSYRMSLPHISGCDVAGVIVRRGARVADLAEGTRVLLAPGLSCRDCQWCKAGVDNRCASYRIRGAATPGGYAELIAARADDAIVIPEGVSDEEAAAFPLVFLTAWHMLITRASLKTGETVLVHAAGSGVGHAAVQIAKHFKATVYTTVGSDLKAQKAQALGADEVINYKNENFEEKLKALTCGNGVDVVFEHIGSQTWEQSLRILSKGGRLVTCGATTGPSVPLDLRYVFSRELSIFGSMMGTRDELNRLIELLASQNLKPIVDTVYPLADAKIAQERMLNRDLFGKLVLSPVKSA